MRATTDPTTAERRARDRRAAVLVYLGYAPVAGWYRWPQVANYIRRRARLDFDSANEALAELVADGVLRVRYYLADRRTRIAVLYIDPESLNVPLPEPRHCWHLQPWAVEKPEQT